jgi:hypothetical protein
MTELVAFRRHGLGDGPERPPLSPQRDDFPNGFLLGVMREKLAGVAATEPERHFPAEVSPAGLLVSLHLADTLTNAVALSLGESGGDGQEQLRKAVT